MKRILSFISALTATVAVALGAVPFNGLILDSTGKPVKGACVYVSDPDRYAKSDKKGRFGLTDVAPTDTLHVKVKKRVYTIPVEGSRSLSIVLVEEGSGYRAGEDPELVDQGYGYVSRREHTGSSTGLSGERLVATGMTDIMQAIATLSPGVDMTGGRVTIRGKSSIMLNSEPLFIIDSTIVPDFSSLNIHDVESVEVLKDGSIYGSRGAGGVIIVHTKRSNR